MTGPSKREEKRTRLELQLRENLKRRKEQARARRDEAPSAKTCAAEKPPPENEA